MDAFLTALYILVGIVVGTIINIVVDLKKERRLQDRLLRGAINELKLNVSRVDTNLRWLQEYHKAVSTETPQQFMKWFSLTTMLTNITNQLLLTGALYEMLSFSEMDKLQGFFSFHSIAAEQRINDQVAKQRDVFDKQMAANEILFWETRFKEQKENLEHVIATLEGRP